jgi:hypothetical protein
MQALMHVMVVARSKQVASTGATLTLSLGSVWVYLATAKRKLYVSRAKVLYERRWNAGAHRSMSIDEYTVT